MSKATTEKKHLSLDEFGDRHASLLAQSDDVRILRRLHEIDPEPLTFGDLMKVNSPRMKLHHSVYAEFNGDAMMVSKLKDWWLIKVLKLAKAESPTAYRMYLEVFLYRLGIFPPEGVLVPEPGKPGRPKSSRGKDILRLTKTLGNPTPLRLAQEFYGKEFGDKPQAERRRIVNALRIYVKRNADPAVNTRAPRTQNRTGIL